MNSRTAIWIGGHTYAQEDKQTVSHTNTWTNDTQTYEFKEIRTDGQTYEQTYGQIDGWTDRHIG